MKLGSLYRRFRCFRPLALLGGGGLALNIIPGCNDDVSLMIIDALEGAANAALPALFDILRDDASGDVSGSVPTVMLDTLHQIASMLA